MIRQKSRIQWLAAGDQNTQFFHKVLRQRINRNKLVSLSLVDGSCIRGHDRVAKEAVSFFQNLLNSEASPYLGRHSLNQYITKALSQD